MPGGAQWAPGEAHHPRHAHFLAGQAPAWGGGAAGALAELGGELSSMMRGAQGESGQTWSNGGQLWSNGAAGEEEHHGLAWRGGASRRAGPHGAGAW